METSLSSGLLLFLVVAGIFISTVTAADTTDNITTSALPTVTTTTTTTTTDSINNMAAATSYSSSSDSSSSSSDSSSSSSSDSSSSSSSNTNNSPALQDDEVRDYIREYNEAVVYIDDEDYYEDVEGPSKPEMEIDKAWFTINSTVGYDIEVWAQSDECYKCDLMYIDHIHGYAVQTLLVNTSYYTDLRLVKVHPGGHAEQICGFHTKFREGGDYWVFIDYPQPGQEISCKLVLANDPDIAEMRQNLTMNGGCDDVTCAGLIEGMT